MLYDSMFPSMEERIDYGFARVLCVLANMFRGEKEKEIPLDKFLPKWGEEPKEKQRRRPVKELKNKFLAWASAHNQYLASQLKEK